MKILVAFDGSECSDAALRDLATAGLPDEAEVVVVSVTEAWLPPPSIEELVAPGEDARGSSGLEHASDLAARACRRLADVFPTWDVRAAVLSGSPASEILAHADEFGPDLMVVGSHGLSALGRFALGSVSQRLVAEAECSVRVARGQMLTRLTGRLLIGLDDSAEAQAAVREVARRRWPEGSEVLLLTVYDQSIGARHDLDRELRRIDQIQWAVERPLRDAGLIVSRLALPGDPKRVLLEKAESWGADCVFVASRGLGRFKRMLLGSVASAVAARAHCSVEVVRERPAR
jgi:nucleotide-binding universal stress UspA family protein